VKTGETGDDRGEGSLDATKNMYMTAALRYTGFPNWDRNARPTSLDLSTPL